MEAEDSTDIGTPVCVLHDKDKKKKKRRKRSTAGADDSDEADGGEPMEWSAALDAELLEGVLPLLPKSVNKRGRDQKVDRLDWSSLKVGTFSEESCKERLGQLEALVRPVKTQYQIVSEALDLVKTKAPVYTKALKPPDAPQGPKRPKSAYLYFSESRRPSVSGKPTEVLVIIAKEWKELTDEKRAKFEKKAQRDKERYEDELKKFKKDHPEMFETKAAAPPKKKTVGPPPPARSAGDLFKADFIRKFKGTGDGRELAKTHWKEMSQVGRTSWKQQWEKTVKDYRRELEKLLKTASEEERQLIEKLLERHTTGKDPSKVGFDLYAKTKRAELRAFHPTWSQKEITDELHDDWAKLGTSGQRRYIDQAKILQTQQDAS